MAAEPMPTAAPVHAALPPFRGGVFPAGGWVGAPFSSTVCDAVSGGLSSILLMIPHAKQQWHQGEGGKMPGEGAFPAMCLHLRQSIIMPPDVTIAACRDETLPPSVKIA